MKSLTEVSNSRTTLVLYPNTVGLAYVVYRSLDVVYDYGIQKIRPFSHMRFLKKARRLLKYAKPNIVILLDHEQTKVKDRVKQAIHDLEIMAKEYNLSVYKYSRRQIRDVFSVFGAISKAEIVEILIKNNRELEMIRPYKRTLWDAEHYQMGVFDAFSLMATHSYLTEQ